MPTQASCYDCVYEPIYSWIRNPSTLLTVCRISYSLCQPTGLCAFNGCSRDFPQLKVWAIESATKSTSYVRGWKRSRFLWDSMSEQKYSSVLHRQQRLGANLLASDWQLGPKSEVLQIFLLEYLLKIFLKIKHPPCAFYIWYLHFLATSLIHHKSIFSSTLYILTAQNVMPGPASSASPWELVRNAESWVPPQPH